MAHEVLSSSSSLLISNVKVKQVLEQYGANLHTGLSTDQASQRREDAGYFNSVQPPINCPAWVCCLLPCIKSIPSMKAYASIQPDDAEVLRNSKWIRYDPASLVPGDVIRIDEGDIVPADCILVDLTSSSSSLPTTTITTTTTTITSVEEELLVDLRSITGEERLKSITLNTFSIGGTLPRLYMGGKVVQGGGIAVISAIGPDTLLAKLIAQKRFPPKEEVLLTGDGEIYGHNDEDIGGLGIAMGDMA